MRQFIKLGIILAAMAGLATAGAYSVSPLRLFFTPMGPAATQRLTITNSEAQPITLSFTPLRNSVSTDGTLTSEPAGGALSVFPPRAVLAPGKSQTVQVRYTGGPSLGVGLYSVHVAQIPVSATQGEAQIKVATEFYIAALVQPQEAKANIAVKSLNRSADGTITVAVENSGTGIGRMSSGEWAAQSGGSSSPVSADAFDFGGTAYILPGTTRTIRVKPEEAAKLGGVSAFTFSAKGDD